MSTVEIETGTYIKRFAFWNPATWSIPKLYWDAWSQEQRLHAICRQLEKVIKYADYLGVNVDDIAARLKAIEEGQLDPVIEAAIEAWFEENEPDILERLDVIEADNWVTTARISDDAVTTAKIADDAVTTDKIADASVTANKISPEYTESIDDKIAEVNKLIEKSEYLPIVTDGWQSFKSGYHTTAGGYQYPWLLAGMALRTDDDIYFIERYSNSDNGAVYKVDKQANNITQVINSIQVGHANDMSYHPTTNKFYVLPGMSSVDEDDPFYKNKIFEYNSLFTEMNSYDAPETWGCMGYDHVTGKLMYAGWEGGVWEYDTANHVFIDQEVELNPVPSSLGFIGQGGGIYNNIAYFACGWNGKGDDNLIMAYDLATGNLAKTYLLPLTSDIFPVGEIEDISFDSNGIMYLASSSPHDKQNQTWGTTVIFKSPITSNVPFGNKYSSVSPADIIVDYGNVKYNPGATAGASGGFIFKTISEALSYAKHNKVRSILLDPYNTENEYHWFEEFVDLDGMGEITFINQHNHTGILGGIYARGNTTIRWDGELHIGMLHDVSWGSKIGLYLKNSSFIGTSLTINAGYDNAIRYGVLMEGVSTYFGTSAPYLASGVTGTAMQDNSTGGGHKYTKFSD